MAVISPLVNDLSQWANVPPGEDVSFALLRGDWKLSFVRNIDTFSIVGTGLHKVALSRMEELFMSFSGKRKACARARARDRSLPFALRLTRVRAAISYARAVPHGAHDRSAPRHRVRGRLAAASAAPASRF